MADPEESEPLESRRSSQVTSDLESLVRLTEQATQSIDKQLEDMERTSIFRLFVTLLAGAFLALSAFAVIRWLDGGLSPQLEAVALPALLSGALSSVFGAYLVGRRASRSRDSLRREVAVHQRLISLADQQIRRASSYGMLSAVASVTYEVRLRRLERRAAWEMFPVPRSDLS